ncbi:MAG: hypothetical protein RL247_246 [Actinomycetota bacterium]
MGSAADISDIAGNCLPPGPVSGSRPRECVSNFMKQNLCHLVLTRLCCEVAGHGDASLSMVALTKPGGGSIEEEMPVSIEAV